MIYSIPFVVLFCETFATYYLLLKIHGKTKSFLSLNSIIKILAISYPITKLAVQIIKHFRVSIRSFIDPLFGYGKATSFIFYSNLVSELFLLFLLVYAATYFFLSILKDGEYEDYYLISNKLIDKQFISSRSLWKRIRIIEFSENKRKSKRLLIDIG